MKVQDKPSTIYVRDIDSKTAEVFSGLKKDLSTKSNSSLVKKLIVNYAEITKELRECKTLLFESRERTRELEKLIHAYQLSHKNLIDCKI